MLRTESRAAVCANGPSPWWMESSSLVVSSWASSMKRLASSSSIRLIRVCSIPLTATTAPAARPSATSSILVNSVSIGRSHSDGSSPERNFLPVSLRATRSLTAGLCPATGGNFAGDHVQPSSVARAFLSPLRLLNPWKGFLQLLQDVRSYLTVRDGLRLAVSIPAHLRHPLSTPPVIAAGRASVIFNRNQNINGTLA